MGDIIPLLMLGALAWILGAFVAWASRRRGWMRIPVVLASVALLTLATFSALANYGMARELAARARAAGADLRRGSGVALISRPR